MAYNRTQARIRCMQINLQHSRTATDNLKDLREHGKSDILFIQEPCLYNRRMTGISTSNRIYTSLEDKNRTAIVIPQKI
jgi:hypothetical protein